MRCVAGREGDGERDCEIQRQCKLEEIPPKPGKVRIILWDLPATAGVNDKVENGTGR